MQHQRSRSCKKLLFVKWPAGIDITGWYLVWIQRREQTAKYHKTSCNKQKIQPTNIKLLSAKIRTVLYHYNYLRGSQF